MAQSLEFSAQQGLTFTAIARSIGSFSGGTPADSVTHQSGTDRYLATFNTNLSAGSKRLDYFLGGVPFGSEIYDITDSNGTFQPRSEASVNVAAPMVTVLPGRDRAIPRSNRGQIILKLQEEIVISRAVVDGNGNPVNLQGRTLQFVIQDARGTDVAVVETNAISISGTNHDTYSFTVPAAATARVFNGEYALNDVTAKSNLAEGDWIVQRRALKD